MLQYNIMWRDNIQDGGNMFAAPFWKFVCAHIKHNILWRINLYNLSLYGTCNKNTNYKHKYLYRISSTSQDVHTNTNTAYNNNKHTAQSIILFEIVAHYIRHEPKARLFGWREGWHSHTLSYEIVDATQTIPIDRTQYNKYYILDTGAHNVLARLTSIHIIMF